VILHKVCAWVCFNLAFAVFFSSSIFRFLFSVSLEFLPPLSGHFTMHFLIYQSCFGGRGSSSRGEWKIFIGFCQERIDGRGRIEICKRCGDLDEKKGKSSCVDIGILYFAKKVRYLFCVSFSSI
jgi:hypothetical protein